MPEHGPSLMTPHICFRQCGSDFGLVGQHVVLTSCICAEEQYLYLLTMIFSLVINVLNLNIFNIF